MLKDIIESSNLSCWMDENVMLGGEQVNFLFILFYFILNFNIF